MTYCRSITQILRIIWVRFIPLSLRSKTRRRETPVLPTWIYCCRSRVTVSCALPFTTNVTISTSISQTFRSWVAIFHLRQPMVFFISQLIRYARACSFYEWRDFHISSSDRDMSWNIGHGTLFIEHCSVAEMRIWSILLIKSAASPL